MKLLYSLTSVFAILLVVSCKRDAPVLTLEEVKGSYVTEIKKNEVFLEDGRSYNLDIEEGDLMFVLTRHAEKDTIKSPNPQLSEEGERRAAKLYDIMKGTRLDAIYSTMYLRTIMTVDSLSRAKGLSIKPYDVRAFKETISYIQDSSNYKRILVSGHSNTTPVMSNYLYGDDFFKARFDEKDYDNLVIVIQKKEGENTLIPLKYKPDGN